MTDESKAETPAAESESTATGDAEPGVSPDGSSDGASTENAEPVAPAMAPPAQGPFPPPALGPFPPPGAGPFPPHGAGPFPAPGGFAPRPMPPAFAPVEQDPWRNARGLNAMFASRGGPPLWPFLIAAVGLLAFVGLRIAAARQAAEQRDAMLALDRDLSEQRAFDPPHVDPWSDAVARDTIGGGPSEAQIRAEAERVCGKLATCGGQSGAVDVVDNCVAQDMALASGIDGRQMVHELLDGIDSACSAKPCDEYVGCYFDRVKAFGDKAGLPSTELTPAERARMEALTCELAAKYGGKTPSLDDPDASPEVRELDALLTKAGPAAADMMKDAVAHCGAPAASAAVPSAGASTSGAGPSPRTRSTRR